MSAMGNSGALPNFFIVGAPKAGTTSLYSYLDQHPQVYMSPIKEPCYFCTEYRPENFTEVRRRQIERNQEALTEFLNGPMREKRFDLMLFEWEDYLKLFRNVKHETAVGEATPCYLWSKTAAGKIFSRIPDAKIVMVLRNPADRAFSEYLQAVASGLVRRSFREHIDAALRFKGHQLGMEYPFLQFGLYYEQVKRYLALFPKDNVLVHLYDDWHAQPKRIIAETFRFLGVDDSFLPDMSRKYQQPRVPRLPAVNHFFRRLGIRQNLRRLTPQRLLPTIRSLAFRPRRSVLMDPSERQYLISYYRDDIKMLEGLLNRDLGTWLR